MSASSKSRKIFRFLPLAFALALTGCATGRYDIPVPRIARPMEGAVVVPFGSRESGVLSRGVWIEGRTGSHVVAAADGRAAFADERMEGYGKTVILEHPGGMWTVYAHLAEILVKPGEAIHKGHSVGRLDAKNKRLYFEFRNGDRVEDPTRMWI